MSAGAELRTEFIRLFVSEAEAKKVRFVRQP